MEPTFRRRFVTSIIVTVSVLMLPIIFCAQTKWDQYLDHWETRWFVNDYALVLPYQLFPNVSGRYFLEMENMTTYDCPRVYWPTCGWDDVSYVNACVLNALNRTTIKRFGPCLTYRRNTGLSPIVVPKKWRTNQTEAQKIRKNFKLTERDFHSLFTFAFN